MPITRRHFNIHALLHCLFYSSLPYFQNKQTRALSFDRDMLYFFSVLNYFFALSSYLTKKMATRLQQKLWFGLSHINNIMQAGGRQKVKSQLCLIELQVMKRSGGVEVQHQVVLMLAKYGDELTCGMLISFLKIISSMTLFNKFLYLKCDKSYNSPTTVLQQSILNLFLKSKTRYVTSFASILIRNAQRRN